MKRRQQHTITGAHTPKLHTDCLLPPAHDSFLSTQQKEGTISDRSHIPDLVPAIADVMYGSLSGSLDGNSGGAAAPMSGGMPGYFLASFFPFEVGGGADDMQLDRALAATRNHREAEKRRRERIKTQLDRLRTILACDPKTDKASLLAKAVEYVRDLKQQTAAIAGAGCLFPSETDEIAVIPDSELSSAASGSRRSSIFKASLCCEDRSDLLPELIDTLRSLRLKTLKAEIATVGGRVRNVLVLARETEDIDEDEESNGGGSSLTDALKALVDRPMLVDRSKRRRVI